MYCIIKSLQLKCYHYRLGSHQTSTSPTIYLTSLQILPTFRGIFSGRFDWVQVLHVPATLHLWDILVCRSSGVVRARWFLSTINLFTWDFHQSGVIWQINKFEETFNKDHVLSGPLLVRSAASEEPAEPGYISVSDISVRWGSAGERWPWLKLQLQPCYLVLPVSSEPVLPVVQFPLLTRK